MPNILGRQAVVIGASIGGLAAVGVLANYFEHVVVLDRDRLPDESVPRAGVPQGAHAHVLIAGGLRAFADLFPGIEDDFRRAGATVLDFARDIRIERFGYDPYPRRSLGVNVCFLTRPVLEGTLRRRVAALSNVELRVSCRVEQIVATSDGSRVTGLTYTPRDDETSVTLAADLVIDASGRAAPTLDLLATAGRQRPTETVIGVDITYATAIFKARQGVSHDWKGVILSGKAPEDSHGGFLFPIEDDRWIVSLNAAHGEPMPSDEAGLRAFAKGLRMPTIYNALEDADCLTPVTRYRFPGSTWRHFEKLDDLPRGILPLGDSMCRFNPVFGQGMSVAAREAHMLHQLLGDLGDVPDPYGTLTESYFAELPALLETPWSTAVLDLIYPKTTGERPPNFAQTLRFGAALFALAARDAEVHKLMNEVTHLVKPRSAYRDPTLQARVQDVMAEMAARR